MADASTPTPRRDEGSDDPSEGPSRGFFSRIIEALSASDGDDEKPDTRPATPTYHSLVNLRRMRAEDVAIPKSEIVAVPVTIGLPDLVEEFRESGRTRIPVYEGSLDQPLGIVNLKDVALKHGFGRGADFDLRAMLRPLLYVPPSMPLATLLQKMQAERIHMALVIDEYGGTDGLCTIEDLLETVVGEIDDEHDVAEPQHVSREGEGVWIVDGATPIEEFEDAIGLDLTAHEEIDAEEVDTMGGLVFLLAGHVAQKGEVVAHPDGPLFEVLDADSRRVRRLRVRLPPSGR
ncbi:hemolysin family protein [Rubellimicrobium aerolatum]|uniref:Hemolysin family protein n=1 Tax=Rubellimicrobium aerolatum TaxID=490979 RepID=A0ABW0SG82_9RHOB|nr:hemolysin family protein [Rubellimicrobium aerolatum]MBP1807317.1 magnesium and cobalt transporter [Rubellimicrobium aerolatum]